MKKDGGTEKGSNEQDNIYSRTFTAVCMVGMGWGGDEGAGVCAPPSPPSPVKLSLEIYMPSNAIASILNKIF